MTSKVKLYMLEEDGDEPRSMGKINSEEDESYALLRERLEKSGAIPWLFKFWNANEEGAEAPASGGVGDAGNPSSSRQSVQSTDQDLNAREVAPNLQIVGRPVGGLKCIRFSHS